MTLMTEDQSCWIFFFCHETLDGTVWTQSDIMTSLFKWCRWLVSFCINSQWAFSSAFKHSASARCSSCSAFQKPSTFPSSTCTDLLWGDFMHFIYRGYFIYVMQYVQQQYFLYAHSSISACFGNSKSPNLLCRRSRSADLFRQDQTN